MNMKKITYIIVILLTLSSCNNKNNNNSTFTENQYEIETVDGCEYISKYMGSKRGYKFAHKGNCKNH